MPKRKPIKYTDEQLSQAVEEANRRTRLNHGMTREEQLGWWAWGWFLLSMGCPIATAGYFLEYDAITALGLFIMFISTMPLMTATNQKPTWP